MTNQPRISILIPVYNGGDLFRETLESFLAQTFGDFEILISDNASADQTESVSREYVARDRRVRYFRNKTNIGLGLNHNVAFSEARGEYFKWAPADDLCCPTYLERCVEVLDRDPSVVLAYPKTRFIDSNRQPLSIEDPGWHLMSDSPTERFRFVLHHCHWANVIVGLVRKAAMAQTRLMPTYPGGDFRVIGELSLLGKFYEIPEYLFMRRLHERSSSQHTKDIGWETSYWSGHRGKLPWPYLHLKADQFVTLVHSQVGVLDKISLTGSLLRSMVGGRRMFFRELELHLNVYLRRNAL